jgi:hypothetical protein
MTGFVFKGVELSGDPQEQTKDIVMINITSKGTVFFIFAFLSVKPAAHAIIPWS